MNENGNTTDPAIPAQRRELSTYAERRELSIHSATDPLPWLIRNLQQKHQKQTEENRRNSDSGEQTS